MREILFRGKTSDGEWVEGFYSAEEYNLNTHNIENIPRIQIIGKCVSLGVIPSTVGQYTGLTDKNGVKIFEGDILAANFDEDFPENLTIVEVVWNEYGWCTKEGSAVPDALDKSDGNLFEVIGNIHDNPGLLETAAKPIDKNIAQSGLALEMRGGEE